MARCLPGSRVLYHPARPREEEREECWEGKVWAAGAAASVRRGPFLRSPLTGLPLSGDYFKIAVFRRPLVSEENRQKQHRQKSPLSSRIKSDGEIIPARREREIYLVNFLSKIVQFLSEIASPLPSH